MRLLKTKIQVLFLLVEITTLAIGKRSFPCWRPLQSLRLLKKDLSEKKKIIILLSYRQQKVTAKYHVRLSRLALRKLAIFLLLVENICKTIGVQLK